MKFYFFFFIKTDTLIILKMNMKIQKKNTKKIILYIFNCWIL